MTAGDPSSGSPPKEAPEEADVPRWLMALEQAQALAHQAARVLEAAPRSGADLRPAARALETALGAVFDAIDRRADRLDATHLAQAELDRAAASVERLPADAEVAAAAALIREARAALAVAEQRFSRVPPEAALPPPELRAGVDTPTLHELTRPSLIPVVRVAAPAPAPLAFDTLPPIPRPETAEALEAAIEELTRRAEARRQALGARLDPAPTAPVQPAAPTSAAEPPPGFAHGRFAAVSAGDFIASRARECLEEIALAGSQRTPLLGDPWRSAKILERRMLAAVDALAALGPRAIARIEPLVLDAPAKDPSRAFGAGMALGCIAGRDAIAAAERVLRHLGPGDPEIAAAFAGALKLVPNPALPLALRTLLGDPEPACRALAIDVLAYRGLATPAELVQGARDPAPSVAAAALPALALLMSPELHDVIDRALAADDPELCEAAWLAMVLGHHPRATSALSAGLSGHGGARAAVLLAIAGDERDAAALIERLRAAPSPALAGAVGWAGAPDGVPALLDLLDHRDPATQLAAAYALDRITGARLYEEVEVEPEAIDVPEIEEPDVGEPGPQRLTRALSDPRDLPSEGAGELLTRPTVRAEAWRAHWAERLQDIQPLARYRRGHPYTPAVSLWELDAWPASPGERRLLQRELVVRTGHVVRFDPHDLVVVQEEALRRWEPLAQRASAAPGGWSRSPRR